MELVYLFFLFGGVAALAVYLYRRFVHRGDTFNVLVGVKDSAFVTQRLNVMLQKYFGSVEQISKYYFNRYQQDDRPIIPISRFIAALYQNFDKALISCRLQDADDKTGENTLLYRLIKNGESVLLLVRIQKNRTEYVHPEDRNLISWKHGNEFGAVTDFTVLVKDASFEIKREIFDRVVEAATVRSLPKVPPPPPPKEVILHKVIADQRNVHTVTQKMSLKHLRKPGLHYPKIEALIKGRQLHISGDVATDVASMSIAHGYNVLLYGPSGSGKSTLSEFIKVELTKAGIPVLSVADPKDLELLLGTGFMMLKTQFISEKRPTVISLDNWTIEDILKHQTILKNLTDGELSKSFNLVTLMVVQTDSISRLKESGLLRMGRFQVQYLVPFLQSKSADVLATDIANNVVPPMRYDKSAYDEATKGATSVSLDTVYQFRTDMTIEQLYDNKLAALLQQKAGAAQTEDRAQEYDEIVIPPKREFNLLDAPVAPEKTMEVEQAVPKFDADTLDLQMGIPKSAEAMSPSDVNQMEPSGEGMMNLKFK